VKKEPIVINLDGDYASLFEGHKIEIKHLFSLDDFISGLIAERPCHLLVRIRSIIDSGKTVNIDIISYHEGEGNFKPWQVQSSEFLKDVERVQIILGSSTSRFFAMGLKNAPQNRPKLPSDYAPINYTIPKVIEPSVKKPESEGRTSKPKTITNHSKTLRIRYPFEKLLFNEGNVSFSHFIDELSQRIDIVIENDFIAEIHESIKPYFSKVLKTKHINVTVSIEYTKAEGIPLSRTQISILKTHSQEVDRITPEIIEEVQLKYLRSHINSVNTTDKSLLTKEDLLKTTSEKEDLNKLYENDLELFEAILKITDTKHHDHLHHLSELHNSEIMRLRFIPRPVSFIFLVKGDLNYHFIWETSDTKEATYIWSYSKNVINGKIDLKKKLNELDTTITEIINNGKNSYIKRKEENFKRIIHTYTDSLDGFNRWKEELKNVII
jgi:hypothetical protein